jgi:threonine dehydratase
LASPSAGSDGDADAARTLLARFFPAAPNGPPSLLPTPLARADSLSGAGRDVYLKIETGLPTASFKVRGAIYSLTTNAARRDIREVVAASTGNHGAAVAYAGRLLGIPATIFLPAHPNPVKAARIRELGAQIVERGADLSAAIDAAYAYSDRAGVFFLHDATDPDIPSGTATIGAEIVEQLPSVDTIYVPMGDTALVRGVARAAKGLRTGESEHGQRVDRVRVVGVAAERAPAYARAWRSGDAIETSSADTIADGLAVRRALAPNVATIRALVDEVRTVTDEEMLGAIEWLLAREQVTAEPAGAAATAAFLADVRTKSDVADAGRVTVLLVTGANMAPEVTALVDARRRRAPGPPP